MSAVIMNQRSWGRTQPIGRLAQFCVQVIALCIPAFINQSPLVYPDTRSYFMGGRAAVTKILAVFAHHTGAGGDQIDQTVQKARGVRSAFYALFTYVPTMTVSFWMVIVLQAMIVSLILKPTFRLLCPGRDGWEAAGFVVLLSIFSTLSWVTSEVMPDVFTSMMILAMTLVIIFWERITHRLARLLVFAIAACVVMHMSNLLIGFGLLVVGFVITRSHLLYDRSRFLAVGIALGAAMLAMLIVGVVGFHQWTMAPQAPPFLLARSLQDGPARLYLQEHCPKAGFEMCNHLDQLDETTEKFLWDSDGVYTGSSVDAQARLRAEDKRIYLAAALEHPAMQLAAMGRNALAQLVSFGMYEYNIPSSANYTRDDMTLVFPDGPPWHFSVTVLEYLIVIGSLIYVLWSEKTPLQRQFVYMMLASVILEALVGAISEPAPRYEARVIWLIPMTALLLARGSIRRHRHG